MREEVYHKANTEDVMTVPGHEEGSPLFPRGVVGRHPFVTDEEVTPGDHRIRIWDSPSASIPTAHGHTALPQLMLRNVTVSRGPRGSICLDGTRILPGKDAWRYGSMRLADLREAGRSVRVYQSYDIYMDGAEGVPSANE